jgi:predicted nucleotidyltransferase
MKLKKNEEIALRTLKETLSKKFSLVDFRIFGSKVRGEDTSDSDIDVMIEIEESNPEIESQIDDIVFRINLKNDTFISTTIFGKKEIEEGPLSESPIYKIIVKEDVSI